MNEKRKKIIAITVCVLFVIAVFSLGWVLSRHYSELESSNGNNVRTTIRNSQKLNEDSQRELDEAIQYNQRAESANQDAQKSADRISDSNDELSRLNAEDQNAIERAEQVFNDVDRANQ
jgi:thiamine biosynthesis lipoprotein ApbE